MLIPLLFAAVQTVSVSVGPAGADLPVLRPDSAALATAFQDSATRELVARARGRHATIDASVFRFSALARERLSVGFSALLMERVLFRRELAAGIEWRRDGPARVEVLGAREAAPMVL